MAVAQTLNNPVIFVALCDHNLSTLQTDGRHAFSINVTRRAKN